MKKFKDTDLSGLPAPVADLLRHIIPEDAVMEIVGGMPCKEQHTDKATKERADYSATCNRDDEDLANPCWQCAYFCFPIGCMYGEEENTDETLTEKPDPRFDPRRPYMAPNGERFYTVPNPDDYVKDAENATIEDTYVVTVYKMDNESGFLTPIARHDYGSKPPTEAQIKWCILKHKGHTAIVTKEYELTW